jgi:SAM-dependent methyltransferase
MSGPRPTLECPCDGQYRVPAYVYDSPPVSETKFDFGQVYRRGYDRCGVCCHWFSTHTMDLAAIYGGDYMDATYGNKMRATYDRIMALPPERSDNAGRAACVTAFAKRHLPPNDRRPRLLDIGSGLAVFPARMREAGWDCTALDPDPRAAEHARDVAGVAAVTGDFRTVDHAALGRFEVITLNKVIEHVENPLELLRAAAPLLAAGGFLYIEVPDGEAASAEGPGREEFFIEHHHVFSAASLAMTVERAGFTLLSLERLREPSTKFTLRAFAEIRPGRS